MSVLAFALRIVLAEILFVSAFGKVTRPGDFAVTVRKFQLLPEAAVRPFAYPLPWVELALGLVLLSGLYPAPAAAVTLGLLIGFSSAVAWAIKKKINTNCDCFGLLYRERVGWSTLGRDGLLMLCAVVILSFDGADWGRVGFHSGYAVLSSVFLAVAYLVPLYLFGKLLPARVNLPGWVARSHAHVDGS